jgi:hypothetical protein
MTSPDNRRFSGAHWLDPARVKPAALYADVGISPALIAFIRILRSRTSTAQVRANERSAALLAA